MQLQHGPGAVTSLWDGGFVGSPRTEAVRSVVETEKTPRVSLILSHLENAIIHPHSSLGRSSRFYYPREEVLTKAKVIHIFKGKERHLANPRRPLHSKSGKQRHPEPPCHSRAPQPPESPLPETAVRTPRGACRTHGPVGSSFPLTPRQRAAHPTCRCRFLRSRTLIIFQNQRQARCYPSSFIGR